MDAIEVMQARADTILAMMASPEVQGLSYADPAHTEKVREIVGIYATATAALDDYEHAQALLTSRVADIRASGLGRRRDRERLTAEANFYQAAIEIQTQVVEAIDAFLRARVSPTATSQFTDAPVGQDVSDSREPEPHGVPTGG